MTIIAIVIVVLAIAILIGRYVSYNNHVQVEGGIYSQDEPSKSLVEANPDIIPDYSGEDVIELRANIPNFTFYDSDPPYLYNRSHLIAYALTGQNANELNLITGTRHFNAEAMLPYELKVMRYLDHSDNHVLYRITPYFKDKELVARGVEMEAYSVEDNGDGVCYHVFVYNVQPGIEIDYMTGENKLRD